MYKTAHYMSLLTFGLAVTAYYVWTGASATWWTGALVAYFCFSCLGVTVTFHRHLAHNSFQFRHPLLRYLGVLFGTLGGTGSAIAWVAVHRAHHRHSDTPLDPHAPSKGLMSFLWPEYDDSVNYRLVKRMMKDPYLHFMHAHALMVFAAYYIVLAALGGVQAVAFFGFIPQAMTISMSLIISWATHTGGYRTYETKDDSGNVWWLALPTWGESWHNNHHAKPNKASFQHKWWEIDISRAVIALIAKQGTVK